MNARYFLLINAILYGAMSLFSVSLPLWADTDQTGNFFAIGLFLLFGFLTVKKLRQLPSTGPAEKTMAPQEGTTEAEQASFYKRMAYISLLAFPFLTLITVWDLNDLESGTVVHVSVWGPIAFLYEHFGYWTGVLAVPILGLAVIISLWQKSIVK